MRLATPEELEERQKIATLNDTLRTTFSGGRVMLSNLVSQLPTEEKNELLNKVRTFDKWTEGNDPYGEHDFGKLELNGQTYYWKIDYYDNDLKYGSEDPTNPAVTTRVMTVMYAEEY